VKILITGGNGYLGGWLFKELEDAGHTVYSVGSRSLVDWTHALDIIETPDCVVHLAWYAKAGEGAEKIHAGCLERTRELAIYIRKRHPLCRVVFASTVSVYGPCDGIADEEHSLNPNCDYTMGKVYGEYLLNEILGESRVCVLRYGSLMGRGRTRDKTDLVVNAFAADAYSRGIIECWSPGAYKPVIHVRDAAWVTRKAMEDSWSGIVNVVSQCPTAGAIARAVQLQTGCRVEHSESDSPRSNRVSSRKLGELVRRRWIEIPEAVREFRDYTPFRGHKTDPSRWAEPVGSR
jgi:nucleoside-diphosphate-sugar epimerase